MPIIYSKDGDDVDGYGSWVEDNWCLLLSAKHSKEKENPSLAPAAFISKRGIISDTTTWRLPRFKDDDDDDDDYDYDYDSLTHHGKRDEGITDCGVRRHDTTPHKKISRRRSDLGPKGQIE